MNNSKERLFEMMRKVGGMVLNENIDLMTKSPPPGFSTQDFLSLDDFVKSGSVNEEDKFSVSDYQTQKGDIKTILQQKQQLRQAGVPLTRDRTSPYLLGSFIEGILDEDGNEWDLEKLKNEITQAPTNLLSEPKKMAKTNAFSVSLPASVGLIFNDRTQKFEVVITCPSAGRCKFDCYAWKGNYIRVPATSLHRLKMLNYVINHWDLFENRLVNEIEGKELLSSSEGLETLIRWHDSGDFFSEKYLQGAFRIAKRTPNVRHYAYTKSISIVNAQDIPENFFFRFSFGGLEDELIDKLNTPYADILYPKEFKSFIKQVKKTEGKQGGWFFTYDGANEDLRKYVAEKYNVDINMVKYVAELQKIPEDTSRKTWTVIVTPQNSDIAGYRKDVLGTILLYH